MLMPFRNAITKLQKRSFRTLLFSGKEEGTPKEILTDTSKGILEKASNEIPKENTVNTSVPIISKINYRDEKFMYQRPREVWLENLDTVQRQKLGLMTLHPDVYGTSPRIDIIHQNIKWQRMYRYVSYASTKTRAEVRGGGRKPWPQKGLGRARHGSIRSPLWRKGGRIHGPRSPTTYFYMLPFFTRVAGLTSALSIKLAQDDLYFIDNLEIPDPNPSYIEELISERHWGPSVLFVDSEDIMPPNITEATERIKHVNLMPVYGLNVYSMLKHETLVLTERAARLIEEKLLFQMYRTDYRRKVTAFELSQV